MRRIFVLRQKKILNASQIASATQNPQSVYLKESVYLGIIISVTVSDVINNLNLRISRSQYKDTRVIIELKMVIWLNVKRTMRI